MLRILSEKVSISIRKHKYAAVPFDSAKFAPSITGQPCVAYRIYVTGTYPLTRIHDALDDLRSGPADGRAVVVPDQEGGGP